MDLPTALALLRLEGSPSWSRVRAAHRQAIRATHPDAGGDAEDATRVNEAYQFLRRLTQDGVLPLRAPRGAPSAPGRDDRSPAAGSAHLQATTRSEPRGVRRGATSEDVLLGLIEVAHTVGDVDVVDQPAGLLHILVGRPHRTGTLTVSVSPEPDGDEGVPVAFTLDPTGSAPAPPIAEVVTELLSAFDKRTGS